jgi:hypothetical protein
VRQSEASEETEEIVAAHNDLEAEEGAEELDALEEATE